MIQVSDEAIDRLVGDLDHLLQLPCKDLQAWLGQQRQLVRVWLEQNVTFRDLYAPQLGVRSPVE